MDRPPDTGGVTLPAERATCPVCKRPRVAIRPDGRYGRHKRIVISATPGRWPKRVWCPGAARYHHGTRAHTRGDG